MKKTFAIILSLMITGLVACGQPDAGMNSTVVSEDYTVEENTGDDSLNDTAKEEEAPVVGMPNPMHEYTSLEEINTAVGCNLCHPAVMGVTDEKFFVIEGSEFHVAEYFFSLNGISYTFRSAPVAYRDISGYYTGDGTAFSDETSDQIEFFSDEEAKLSRWFNIEGQYVLMAKDNGQMDQETFEMISEELSQMTNPALSESDMELYYASLEGQYYDSWSQRAGAEITANGDKSITIVVEWSSSAWELDRWTMHASRSEDGLLYYTDCIRETVTYSESGEETSVTDEFPAEGYFGESEGKLYWNGAGDEQCAQCVFEKPEY